MQSLVFLRGISNYPLSPSYIFHLHNQILLSKVYVSFYSLWKIALFALVNAIKFVLILGIHRGVFGLWTGDFHAKGQECTVSWVSWDEPSNHANCNGFAQPKHKKGAAERENSSCMLVQIVAMGLKMETRVTMWSFLHYYPCERRIEHYFNFRKGTRILCKEEVKLFTLDLSKQLLRLWPLVLSNGLRPRNLSSTYWNVALKLLAAKVFFLRPNKKETLSVNKVRTIEIKVFRK